MKKSVVIGILSLMILTSLVSATCDLDATLVSQDPAKAIPGEYVKLVFQLGGLADNSCGKVSMTLQENFPFSLDAKSQKTFSVESGFYKSTFGDHMMGFYEVRVDKDAIEGENPITLSYTTNQASLQEDFNINVEDARTDFEVSVSDYSETDKKLSLEILNVGESNVDAVTIEIPESEIIKFYGTNRNIVGDIDQDEDEKVNFEADLAEGTFDVNIFYTDDNNVRRTLTKQVYFNNERFSRTIPTDEGMSSTTTFFIGLLIPIIIFLVLRWNRKRKEKIKKRLQR